MGRVMAYHDAEEMEIGFPSIGDAEISHPVMLTEAEIGSIKATAEYLESNARSNVVSQAFWSHYGPTVKGFVRRMCPTPSRTEVANIKKANDG